MAQGIKNRKIGDLFVDETNKQIRYTLTRVELLSIDEIKKEHKIVNKSITNFNRFKSAVFVELVRKRRNLKYSIVRLFEKKIESIDQIPAWGGQGLKEDFDYAYGIKPRLKSSISGQTVYQTSLLHHLSSSFIGSDELVNFLVEKSKENKSQISALILSLLNAIQQDKPLIIENYSKFKKEISIYFSEILIPLLICLNKTSLKLDNPKLVINGKVNQIGYDSKIIDGDQSYLISIKQSGNQIGAYGSIKFLKHLIESYRDTYRKHIPQIDVYESLLDLLLGSPVDEDKRNDIDLAIDNITTRKTYRTLFTAAQELGIPPLEIEETVNLIISKNEDYRVLNNFAIKVYQKLNEIEWFVETTKVLLKKANFIQCKLAIKALDNDKAEVIGLDIYDLSKKEKNTIVEFSARKSYFGNLKATGHGGFLIKIK